MVFTSLSTMNKEKLVHIVTKVETKLFLFNAVHKVNEEILLIDIHHNSLGPGRQRS